MVMVDLFLIIFKGLKLFIYLLKKTGSNNESNQNIKTKGNLPVSSLGMLILEMNSLAPFNNRMEVSDIG